MKGKQKIINIFSYLSLGKDFVYIINKTDIMIYLNSEYKEHMRNIELTIGVYSNKIDSITFFLILRIMI